MLRAATKPAGPRAGFRSVDAKGAKGKARYAKEKRKKDQNAMVATKSDDRSFSGLFGMPANGLFC